MGVVEMLHQVQLEPLLFPRCKFTAQVEQRLVRRTVLSKISLRSLKQARQESRRPPISISPKRDEPGKTRAFAAQSIKNPGTKAGTNQGQIPRVHQRGSRTVGRHIGGHRANHAQLVRQRPQVRENFAQLQTALPALGEIKRGREPNPRISRQRLVTKPGQFWLGIEGVQMTGCPAGKNVDDTLRFGRQGRLARGQRGRDFRSGCFI